MGPGREWKESWYSPVTRSLTSTCPRVSSLHPWATRSRMCGHVGFPDPLPSTAWGDHKVRLLPLFLQYTLSPPLPPPPIHWEVEPRALHRESKNTMVGVLHTSVTMTLFHPPWQVAPSPPACTFCPFCLGSSVRLGRSGALAPEDLGYSHTLVS